MANRSLRPLFALGLVVATAAPGLAQGAAAEPTPPASTASCWVSMVNAEGDKSFEDLGAWDAASSLAITSSGATAVGGIRAFALGGLTEGDAEKLSGPAVSSEGKIAGRVRYFIDVEGNGDEFVNPIEITREFELESGAQTLPLGFEPEQEDLLTLVAAGDVSMTLRGVVYELDGTGASTYVCHGSEEVPQFDTDETPEDELVASLVPTDVSTVFKVSETPEVSIAGIDKQRVNNAARAGDVLSIGWHGLPTGSGVEVALCVEGEPCDDDYAPLVDVATDDSGAGATTYELPSGVEHGQVSLWLRPRSAEVEEGPLGDLAPARAAMLMPSADPTSTRLRVLGEPVLTLIEGSTSESIGFTGGDWDPGKVVWVSAHDGSGEVVASDEFTADGDGVVSGLLAADGETAISELRAAQARTEPRDDRVLLTASIPVDLAATVLPADPGDPKDPDDGNQTDPGTDTPATTTPAAPGADGPAAPETDIPETEGLPVEEVPAPLAELEGRPEVALVSAELIGSTSFGDLFGAGPERTLRLRIENVSDDEVVAPGLMIAVGKDEPEPAYVGDGVGRLAPGETTVIEVPITLPVGAHGVYTISGRIGGGASGDFELTWETWPWGLFGLNALGAALVAWALRRRFLQPAPALITASAGLADPTVGVNDGEAVIDLATLEQWWALTSSTEGAVADAVVDEAAVERWLERAKAREMADR